MRRFLDSQRYIRLTNRFKLWRLLPCPLAHRWVPTTENACWGLECCRCLKYLLIRDLMGGAS